jgi:hypothetical protein
MAEDSHGIAKKQNSSHPPEIRLLVVPLQNERTNYQFFVCFWLKKSGDGAIVF